MVESRVKPVLQDHCHFCGEFKDDVPLILTSQLAEYNNPAICANCAMSIVQQTFIRFGVLDKQIRAQMDKPPTPDLFTPANESDGVQQAIETVQGKKNGEGE